MNGTTPDRLRFLIDTIIRALDEKIDGDDLAKRAYLSRFHFDRLVARGLKEAPATFRRRLLLERAAWRLKEGGDVTNVGLESGYEATEAFSRAFARAYGVPPSRFAAESRTFRLDAPNGIHFHPPAGLYLSGVARTRTMDITDRLLEHDAWLTEKLIDSAARLSEEDLDREVRPGNIVFRFEGPEPSVRSMLAHHVFAKEVWVAAMGGTAFPKEEEQSMAALRSRHKIAAQRFAEITRGIRDRGEWDDAFVDALCEPPESFTYGSVIAHIIEHAAHRRLLLTIVLRELGVKDLESPCPIDWERKING
jgi:AraC family transcriptional regulator